MWIALSLLIVATSLSVTGVIGYLSFMTARNSGWRELATSWACPPTTEVRRIGIGTGSLNGYAFAKTLVLGASESGLYLRPILLLRAFHTPLLLPWSVLEAERFERRHSRGLRLGLQDRENFELTLPESVRKRLVACVDETWNEAHSVLDPD